MKTIRTTQPARMLAALCLLTGAAAAPARAHFYWTRLAPGTPPKIQVLFTEAPSEATTPDLLERIKTVRARAADGSAIDLKPADGYMEGVLPGGARVVGLGHTWGVLDRGEEVFLLQYYAKAAASGAAAESARLHFEVFARRDGASWVANVKHGSRPERGAELTIHRPGEASPLVLQTDEKGEARFQVSGSGLCGIRARAIEAESGEFEGKSYKQKRYYSTLTFPIGAESGATAAAPATTADPRAYELLKAAHDSRQTLPTGFPGFTAEVVLDDSGRMTTGSMTYTPGEGVDLKIEGATEEAASWLRGALGNAVGHRRGGDFAQGDGRHPLTLGPDDGNPLGRQVVLNDPLQSSYRVRDNQVTEVVRTMGDRRFVITVLETESGDGRKYLPRHFVVTYFDAATGAIQEVQCFSDTHARIKGAWLPTSRRVITAANGRLTSRRFELRNVRMLPRQTAKQ